MRRLFGFAVSFLCAASAPTAAQDATVVIHTSKLIDGRGAAMSNADIVVVNGTIARVGPAAAVPKGAREIDLRGRTVLPGLIDVHSHLTWYFNRKGRYHTRGDGDTPIESILAAAANAYATLMAGFTTIQSPGSAEDADLRDWIATQGLPGPRILTSLDAADRRIARYASHARAEAEGAGRRPHQDLRLGEHSRWRQADA